jgi:hypothetical protein
MIKMSAFNPKTNTDFYILGLSEGNLIQLRKGRPIHILGVEWNKPFDLMLFWGPTDEQLVKIVEPFIGPKTRVTDQLTNRPRKN